MIGYAIAGLVLLAVWIGMAVITALGFGHIIHNRDRRG